MLSYLAYVYDFFPLDAVKYNNEVMNSSHTSALWTTGLRYGLQDCALFKKLFSCDNGVTPIALSSPEGSLHDEKARNHKYIQAPMLILSVFEDPFFLGVGNAKRGRLPAV